MLSLHVALPIYVDAGAASLGLAALYLVTGLRGAIDLDPSSRGLWIGRLVTAGMVAGLACGAKSSNLLLAPFLVFYVLAVQWTPSEPSMRSEEHTSELQSLMRNSYAVFCL